jgi:hypothetical protein
VIQGTATVFSQIIAAVISRISNVNERESDRIEYKLETEMNKSEESHQMTAAIIRGKTVVERSFEDQKEASNKRRTFKHDEKLFTKLD